MLNVIQIFQFEKLNSLKVNALTLIGIFYGLGYVSWSIYAAINSLGIVPAVDLQYLISGILPATLILLVYIILKYRKPFLYKIDICYSRKAKTRKEATIRNLIIFSPLVLTIIISYIAYHINLDNNATLFFFIFIAYFILIMIGFSIQPIDSPVLSVPILTVLSLVNKKWKFYCLKIRIRLSTWLRIYVQSAAMIIVSLLMFLMFYAFIFPRIPQELGGGKPKKCVMLSEKNIFSINSQAAKPGIQYTDTVDVYYYNSSVLIYKKYDGNAETVEVSRSNVQSIYWLN